MDLKKCPKRSNENQDVDDLNSKRKRLVNSKAESKYIETGLYNLPNELLLSIFGHLKSIDLMDICLTCNRFFDLCCDKSLWRVIRISEVDVTSNLIKQYLNFAGPYTEEIWIVGNSNKQTIIDFDHLYTIKVKCPNLSVLHLENQALDSFEIFLSAFPRSLKELSFANCTLRNSKYLQRFFTGIDAYFIDLQTFILSNCDWFSTHSIMAVSKLPKLKKLCLDGCEQLINFMPYLSLSSRYGFKSLEIVDLRRTMVSDSEVSCFNAIKTLKELYLEPPEKMVAPEEKKGYEELNEVIKFGLENEILEDRLENLKDIIVNIENMFEGIDEESLLNIQIAPKIKILKANFDAILNDIGSNYTKLGFHKLFCNLSNLEKLIKLELNATDIHFIVMNKHDFKEQSRTIETSIKSGQENNNKTDSNKDSNLKTNLDAVPSCSQINENKQKEDNSNNSEEVGVDLDLPETSTSANRKKTNQDNEHIISYTEPDFDSDICRIVVQHNQYNCFDMKSRIEVYHNEDAMIRDYKKCNPLLGNDLLKKIKKITNKEDDESEDELPARPVITIRNNTIIYTINQQVPATTGPLPFLFAHQLNGYVISNRTIHALFNQRSECTQLERISFRGCIKISDDGLFFIGQSRQHVHMVYLDVRGTSVTKRGCDMFKLQKPWCNLVSDFGTS